MYVLFHSRLYGLYLCTRYFHTYVMVIKRTVSRYKTTAYQPGQWSDLDLNNNVWDHAYLTDGWET